MTGHLPYKRQKHELSLVLALAQRELPADVSALTLPDSVKKLLIQCWQHAPMERPPISHCAEVLQPGALFRRFVNQPWVDVPRQFKAEGQDWTSVHNPAVKVPIEMEWVSTFRANVEYVIPVLRSNRSGSLTHLQGHRVFR